MVGWSMLRTAGRRIGVKGVDEGAANQLNPELDDWELAGDEDHGHHHGHDRLPNFGSAPVEKEFQEAASKLQDALVPNIIPVFGTFDQKIPQLSSSSVHEISESIKAGTIEHNIASSSASSMHEISDSVETGTFDRRIASLSLSSSEDEITDSVEAGTFDHKIASLSFSSAQDEISDSVEAGTFDHKTALPATSSMHEIFESVEDDTFDHKIALLPTCLVQEESNSVEAGNIDLKTTLSSFSSVQAEISDSVEAGTFDHKTSSSSVQDEISDSVEADTFNHKTALSSSSSVHEISDSIEASTFDHETASSSSSTLIKGSDLVVFSSIRENWNKSCGTLDNQMELELHEDNYKMLQKVGHNNVREAFHLLQNNLAVQRMVMSVASDKAVLDALLKNEKVHEFRQSFQQGELKRLEISQGSEKPAFRQENPFFQAIETIKTKVMEFTEKTTEVFNQFLGFTDKKILLEKDGDMDRALKASLILFVALLVTVLVRRI